MSRVTLQLYYLMTTIAVNNCLWQLEYSLILIISFLRLKHNYFSLHIQMCSCLTTAMLATSVKSIAADL